MARRAAVLAAVFCSIVASASLPPSASGLFSSSEPLGLEIEAPFNALFAHAKTLNDAETVDGTVTLSEAAGPKRIAGVRIGLRGNTSLRAGECTFPKLKLNFGHARALADSVFAGQRTLKVGTHCGELPPDAAASHYGRLRNEMSVRREAFVYRLLAAVGVPTLRVRPARITYRYTDAAAGESRRPLVRRAILIEDEDAAVKRLGGARRIDERSFTNAHAEFATADTAIVAFGEALIGNFDWCLKMTPTDAYRCNARHPLWNVLAIGGAAGARPLIYDFNVAGMVSGGHHWFTDTYNDAFLPSRSHVAVEVLGQVQRTRTLFPRADLDRTRRHFLQRKPDAYRLLAAADLDDAGRQLAREHLDAFYGAIDSDEAFYRPAIVRDGQRVFADAAAAQPICADAGTIPVGTVVSDPIEGNGRMMKVVLLDTAWHWATPAPCAPIHTGAVWVARDAVSRDFPAR